MANADGGQQEPGGSQPAVPDGPQCPFPHEKTHITMVSSYGGQTTHHRTQHTTHTTHTPNTTHTTHTTTHNNHNTTHTSHANTHNSHNSHSHTQHTTTHNPDIAHTTSQHSTPQLTKSHHITPHHTTSHHITHLLEVSLQHLLLLARVCRHCHGRPHLLRRRRETSRESKISLWWW